MATEFFCQFYALFSAPPNNSFFIRKRINLPETVSVRIELNFNKFLRIQFFKEIDYPLILINFNATGV